MEFSRNTQVLFYQLASPLSHFQIRSVSLINIFVVSCTFGTACFSDSVGAADTVCLFHLTLYRFLIFLCLVFLSDLTLFKFAALFSLGLIYFSLPSAFLSEQNCLHRDLVENCRKGQM